jgi:hypothetical protein
MSVRSWDAAWLVVGLALVLGAVAGLATGAFGGVTGGADSSAESALVLIAVVGFGIAAWQIHRDDVDAETADAERPGDRADSAGQRRRNDEASREADDPVVAATPEYAATDDVLSGQGLSWVLDEGGAVAREDRTVAAGEEWVRPTLRGVLLDVLVHEHRDRTAAEAVVDEGDWTDDRVAASVVSGTVTGPPLSFRERIYAWLFPERVLRERVRVTVAEIARVADETLPAVPGERAPRTIPVVTPSVDDLQRTADGDLDLAVGVTADSSDGEESRRDRAPAGEPDRGSQGGDR